MSRPLLFERLRAYIGEQTGLPSATIDAVLAAEDEFWRVTAPEALAAAIQITTRLDEGV